MSDTDVTLDYPSVSRKVYARRTLGDIVLAAGACVAEVNDDCAPISIEDQEDLSNKYHADDSLVGYPVVDPTFYDIKFSAPAKPIVPGLEGYLRHIFTEALQNARRATVKLIREFELSEEKSEDYGYGRSVERPSGKIDVSLSLDKGWYVFEVQNYGAHFPEKVLEALSDVESSYKKNGDTSLVEKSIKNAHEAFDKNQANGNGTDSGVHGGLGLLLMKAGLMKYFPGSSCIPSNNESGALLTIRIPYVVLHPIHDCSKSPAPEMYNSVIKSSRSKEAVPVSAPGSLGSDSARFNRLFYRK